MNTQELINKLKTSGLYAECSCQGEFRLSDVILFDGTKPFPENAHKIQEIMLEELEGRKSDLEKRKNLAQQKAEITAKSVNIGKRIEAILPIMKDFNFDLPDCRFLNDPIDLIVFNGLCCDKITSLSFIEVKTGGARLGKGQKAIKDAICENKVRYKEI